MTKASFTPKDLADRWNIEPNTLSQWRWNRKGPTFVKEGHKISYHLENIENFEKQQRRQRTISDQEKRVCQVTSEDQSSNREGNKVKEK